MAQSVHEGEPPQRPAQDEPVEPESVPIRRSAYFAVKPFMAFPPRVPVSSTEAYELGAPYSFWLRLRRAM